MLQQRRFFLSSLLTLLASPGWAAVSGRVLSLDGTPARGATVEALAQETATARALRLVAGQVRTPLATTRSAEDGSFRLDTAAVVGLDVVARCDGFAPTFGTISSEDLTTLVLRPAGLRRGMVTAGGKPVVSAIVAWAPSDGGGSGELVLKTGPDGSYDVPDPDVWAASLLILHPDHAPLETARETARWPTPLSHALDTGVPIEGSVVDEATGRAVAGAALWVGGWPVGRSSSRGAFRIPHAPSSWSAVVAIGTTVVGVAKPGSGPLVISARAARSISGAVRDAKTSQPLRGALVTIRGERTESTLTATSDARGWYSFPALAAERFSLSASLSGYSLDVAGQNTEAEDLDLRKRISRQHDFAFVRDRRLSGRVEDEEHRPIDNAIVTLGGEGEPNVYFAGEPFAGTRPATRTGRDGTFVLALSGEDQRPSCVVALKDGYAAGRSALVALDVEPLRSIAVTLTRGIELHGRVAATDGTPLADVAVALAEDGVLNEYEAPTSLVVGRFEGPGWTRTDAEGLFVTHVHAGVHHLAFRKSGFSPKLVQRFEAAPGSRIDVTLDPTAAIRGRVVRSDSAGVPGVSVSAMTRGMMAGRFQATTDGEGAFALTDLAPGRYEVFVGKEQTGIAERRAVETPGADVVFELAPAGTLRGRAFDAKSHEPIPRFTLSLQRASEDENPPPSPAGFAVQGQDPAGAFVVTEVAAGEWTVTLAAEGYPPRILEGVAVSADADDPSLEIALDKGAVVRGHTTTRGGEPLSDVQITGARRSDGEDVEAESDENGDFELIGLPGGAAKLEFRHEGFVTERRAIDAAKGGRVDVVLSRGLSVQGTVVSEGVGVPNASVEAWPGTAPAERQHASTGQDGRFTVAGLVAGRYSFEASLEGKGEAKVEDVDVSTGTSVRLVLQEAETATLVGSLTGLPENDELVLRMVTAESEDGRRGNATADASGRFRMDKAPTGKVKVRAYARSLAGAQLSSRTSELTLAAGSESQTVIEFGSDTMVSGTVTRRGAPLPDVTVSFRAAEDGDDSATSQTDASGAYEVIGLEAGPHTVNVYGRDGVSYELEYVVTGSSHLDIDVTGASVRGQVVDAASREPLAGVDVSFWLLGGRENEPATSVATNARGQFSATSLRDGRYRLLTSKQGYGQETREIDLNRGATAEAAFELVAAEGLRVKVSDARDGRPLDAIVVARDPARKIVANRHSDPGADGVFTIALGSGPYLLSASASGYGTQTMPVTAPGQGIALTLTPGGTLVVESDRDLHGRIRLVQPDGEEYVRCWCNGIADIQVKGRRTVVTNITPGTYTVELVDHQGVVSGGGSVSIGEGQTTTVRIE